MTSAHNAFALHVRAKLRRANIRALADNISLAEATRLEAREAGLIKVLLALLGGSLFLLALSSFVLTVVGRAANGADN